MKYTIICDESGVGQRKLILGSIITPSHNHNLLAKELVDLKSNFGINPNSDFKWDKVSAKYLDRYKKLVDWLFSKITAEHLKFRAHIIDTTRKDFKNYGDGDKEKAFFKLYYHLIYRLFKTACNAEECEKLLVLLDNKQNRYPFRLNDLKYALNSAIKRDYGVKDLIGNIEFRNARGPGHEPLIQIVDIFIGSIRFVRSGDRQSPEASVSKNALVEYIEKRFLRSLEYDTHASASFNLWTFDIAKSVAHKHRHKKKTAP